MIKSDSALTADEVGDVVKNHDQAKTVIAVAVAQAGKEALLEQKLRDGAEASWAEGGVRKYVVHKIEESPGTFCMVEVYESEEAFQAHLGTPHVLGLLAELPELIEGELTVYQGVPLQAGTNPKAGLA